MKKENINDLIEQYSQGKNMTSNQKADLVFDYTIEEIKIMIRKNKINLVKHQNLEKNQVSF